MRPIEEIEADIDSNNLQMGLIQSEWIAAHAVFAAADDQLESVWAKIKTLRRELARAKKEAGNEE